MNVSTYFNTHLMPILARRPSRNERFSFGSNRRYKFVHSTRSQFREPSFMMAGNKDAMDDLKGILANRAPFYAKAEMHLDTSARPLGESFLALRTMVAKALQIEGKH